jgi:adenosylhomocysteine nucleosidase
MIAIIAAMDKELALLVSSLSEPTVKTIADHPLYLGWMNGVFVVVAKSGIGKINAAMTTAMILSTFPIEAVINTGVAGGLAPTKNGDVVLASAVVSFDADVTAIDKDLAFGQIYGEPLLVSTDRDYTLFAKQLLTQSNIPYVEGVVASGDQFVTRLSTLKRIREVVQGIVACDMEAQAVGSVAAKFHVPFVLIRGISDVVESQNQEAVYTQSVADIANKTATFVQAFVGATPWKQSK